MIRINSPGNFRKTRSFLDKLKNQDLFRDLHRYGRVGVDALSSATPRDSGKTAGSWTYGITRDKRGTTIYWNNTNENKGSKIAILIQYGHGTGTGGYVIDKDYINPAMGPIFDRIAQDVWKRVTNG